MHKELKPLLEKRCAKFKNKLNDLIVEDSISLKARYSVSEDHIKFIDRENGNFKEIQEGEQWGNPWDSAWFNIKAQVPYKWKGKNIVLKLNLNGEALLFSKDGQPLYAYTHGAVWEPKFTKEYFRLFEPAEGGEDIDLWIEAAANGLFGIILDEDPDPKCPQRHGTYDARVKCMKLCVFDEEMNGYKYDFDVLCDLMLALPENTPRRKKILRGLSKSIDVYNDDRSNVNESRKILQELLECHANDSSLTAVSVGHAHIDTGWLWPVKESVRKTARTFATQMYLIDRYSNYVFGASQAQHYQFMKDHYPELYRRIHQYVKSGNWEIQGGMWVEADCNLISGESMIRQFVHGKNFFYDEFGVDVKNLWLPDVFGYSAVMPQIMKKSGIDYFLTQKISWSQFNTFPHHTFIWEGIDGSSVLTHFIPTDTYNGFMNPQELIGAENRFVENDVLDEYLSVFGIGDGGGGSSEEHIELGLRQQDLEGCPKVKFDSAQNFFDRLEEKRSELDKWNGELYLELHRGTLTTQSRVKKQNRQIEKLLKAVEFLYSSSDLNNYPQKELDRIWKTLLINQFHDIIPGSSIKKVYDVTHQEYDVSIAECNNLIKKFGDKVLINDDSALTIFNIINQNYTRPINIGKDFIGFNIIDSMGNEVVSQDEEDGKLVLFDCPEQQFITLFKSENKTIESKNDQEELILENNYVRYRFNEKGEIIEAFDKEAVKQILTGGNKFQLYVDRPSDWDAWDVDIYYENQRTASIESLDAFKFVKGRVRSGLQFNLKINDSLIYQKVYLSSNSKRLDFETEVDWHERHKMLRVSFDANVRSSEATFDIQYGYVKRNTHRNTSWDMAKFEVAAHKYVDLSDNQYGVALLNDCKYGHKVIESVIDLNLLRSPTHPDADADVNQKHVFTYCLYPHNNSFIQSDVIKEALMLNNIPAIFAGRKGGKIELPCKLDNNESVSLEVIKKAEKEDCLIIRLVELKGLSSTCRLNLKTEGRISETNLMEWEENKWSSKEKSFEISLKPFEIRTFKLNT